jgi:hypothetical protein
MCLVSFYVFNPIMPRVPFGGIWMTANLFGWKTKQFYHRMVYETTS